MKITVEKAAEILKAGGMVILTDHEDRENEGDLVGAASLATPQMVNFMASKAKGLICCAIDRSCFDAAGLEVLPSSGGPDALHGTRFCTPVDAVEGCTTGISASDRSISLNRLAASDCRPDDFARPGHMFPILEAEGGLAARDGHTEGSVYLMRQAGLPGAAVICEMMDDDGTMVRGGRIDELSEEWGLGVLSVKDLVAHQKASEAEPVSLPIDQGEFTMEFLSTREEEEHFCLSLEDSDSGNQPEKAPLVRIHSECLTGDLFRSKRCDCGSQLESALDRIAREGRGYLLYLRQEGRGIGLRAKMRAYKLQEGGMDTLDANLHLGYPADARDYDQAAAWLLKKGIKSIRLMTNNPDKISQLEEAGIEVERVPLIIEAGENNLRYISTKQERMGHLSA